MSERFWRVKPILRKFFAIPELKREAVTVFTRQLATMLHSGLPLLRSLEILQRQERGGRSGRVIAGLADRIRSGDSLSDGLQEHPRVFGEMYLSMVRAGEAAGQLDAILLRLADYLEKQLKTVGKVKTAMLYPAVVLTVSILVVGLLTVFVIPRFRTIYSSLLQGAPLPSLTERVIEVSEFSRQNWWVIGCCALVLYVFGGAIWRVESVRRKADSWLLRVPKLGPLSAKLAISRFGRTLATLLRGGVAILDALKITRGVVGNRAVMKAIDAVHDWVRDGEAFTSSLQRSRIFPELVTSMVEVGEETGELGLMLERVAETYEEDLDNAIAGLTALIEPLIIVLLAIVVGLIVVVLFLPIINMLEHLGGI